MSQDKEPLQVAGWLIVWRTSWGQLDYGVIEPNKERALFLASKTKNYVGLIYVSGTEDVEPANAVGVMPERVMTKKEKEALQRQNAEDQIKLDELAQCNQSIGLYGATNEEP